MFKQVLAIARPNVDAVVNRRRLRSDARLDSTRVPKAQQVPLIVKPSIGSSASRTQGIASQATQAQTNESVTQGAFSDPLHSQVSPINRNH